MNIYFLITGLSSGGAERNLLYICEELVQEYNITVVVLGAKGFYSSEFERINCRVIYLELNKGKIAPLNSFLREYIGKNSKDIILSSWLYHADLLSILLKMIKPSVKVFWNVRTAEIGLNYFRLSKIILHTLKLFSYIIPSKILYNSYRGKQIHEKFGYANKGVVVKNIFTPPRKSIDKLNLHLDTNKINFGFMGRNVSQKGIGILLEAFVEFSKTKPQCNLVLAGFEIDNNGWEKYESKNIIILGKIRDVRSLYKQLDVFVLPSIYGEGTPNVILEALFFELPCIASDVGDTSLLLASDRGIVINPGDVVALIDAFEKMFNFLKEDTKLNKQNRKLYVLNEYKKTTSIQEYTNEIIYNENYIKKR